MDEMKVPVNPTPSELNPNIEDIKTKHPFHGFWVQKALPLVYDDSLSYYEVISRIQEYINGLSDDVKTLAVNVDNLLDAYNQLVSWVDAEITRYETELNQEFDQHKQAVVQMFNTFKSELENTFEQYKDELKEQSDQHMSELEQQFEAYKNELKTQADQHKSELETQFEGYKSDIDNQISEFKDDVDQTLQEQDRKIQQNSDDISDIQTEQETQNTNIQNNADAISNIQAEQKTQNTNIQNNADAISNIQTEQQTQNTAIQQNASDISDIQTEQETQNTNIQNNADAISNIQAEQKTQNTNIQNNADAISNIQTEQQTQNTAIQQNASDIQTALTEIDGSLAAVESDVVDLQKSQSEQDSTIQSIQTDVANKANKDGSNATATWPISITGKADSAAKLTTARSLKTNLGSTTAVTFDGSAAQDNIPITGTLAIGHGGTGATTAAAARTALEITPENIGAVPTSRKVNSKALTADISLSASDVGAVAKTGDTMTGDLTLSGASRAIKFASGTRTAAPITFYAGDANGSGIVIGDGGRTIIGGGEAAQSLRGALGTEASKESAEEMHIASDGSIYLHAGCQTIGQRKTVTINGSGNVNAPGGFTGSLTGTADKVAHALKFTGKSTVTFDGSADRTVDIPDTAGDVGAYTKAEVDDLIKKVQSHTWTVTINPTDWVAEEHSFNGTTTHFSCTKSLAGVSAETSFTGCSILSGDLDAAASWSSFVEVPGTGARFYAEAKPAAAFTLLLVEAK